MATTKDIQGNSWTDEPEIPNTKREGGKPANAPDPQNQQNNPEPAAEQRPPSDS